MSEILRHQDMKGMLFSSVIPVKDGCFQRQKKKKVCTLLPHTEGPKGQMVRLVRMERNPESAAPELCPHPTPRIFSEGWVVRRAATGPLGTTT